MPEHVDAVFHVAADLSSWSRGDAAQTAVNVQGTHNLVEAALARQARRFILTSSLAAYGRHDAPVSEATPSNAPRSRARISQTLIEYSEESTLLRASVVALLNTALLLIATIALATPLGVIVGVARIGPNGLIARLATAYVETFRNIPVLADKNH
jgi:ABC-type amino acid transport system permease subunit